MDVKKIKAKAFGAVKDFLPATKKQMVGTGVMCAGTCGLTVAVQKIASKFKNRKKGE